MPYHDNEPDEKLNGIAGVIVGILVTFILAGIILSN